jgi:HD-GYP domain-containing protein (c-di-GMP phosphodiesterase class II)
MTVQSIDASLSAWTLRAREALYQALKRPLEVWQRQASDDWRRIDANGFDEFEAKQCLVDADHELVNSLLEQAYSSMHAAIVPLASDRSLLAVPLLEYSGGARAVALTVVESASGPYAQQLSDLVLRDIHQRQEVAWLRDENFAFSQQVTDDFEELTFLRTMATHMVVEDTTLDIWRIVDNSIGGLREMIGAETIFFVTPTHGDELGIALSCSSSPDDGVRAVYDTVKRLAAEHRARVAHGPCVRIDLATADVDALEAGIRQFLMVPIVAGTRHFGWFVAVNRAIDGRKWAPSPLLQLGHDEFGTWEASLLSTAASLLASHASNLELIREKEQLLVNTVRSLVTALDSKDAYTRGHSERVALFSKRIAEKLGYDESSAERLYLSGLLHDVGKIGVSDAVLRKPDKLTPEEFAEIKRHPDEGWAILRDLEQMRYVLPGVLHHHEQVDGSGYPDGLAGNDIPLDARIMAVADAYDAMTSDRAYRAGMPHEKALSILGQGSGTQWDAGVVEAFTAILDDIMSIRYGYKPAERVPRQGSALAPNCQS